MGFIEEKIRDNPFVTFAGKKLLFVIIGIFLAMTLVFILPRLMPSTPVDIMIGRVAGRAGGGSIGTIGGQGGGGGGGSALQVLREVYSKKFGIGKPIHLQYLDFWKRFLTMDFGLSYWRYPVPVSSLVASALPWTMALIMPVLPIGFVLGNWIGSRAAFYRGKLDRFLYYFSMYLFRAPYYWFALIFIVVFGVILGWFPLQGAYSAGWKSPVLNINWFLDAMKHYILPFASLLGIGIGNWAVGMRAMSIYEMESDYINYSKQLGFSRGKLRQYIEKNSILPNFTWLPIILKTLISQTLIVEIVFGYPGLGTLLYNGVFSMDYPLIEAGFVITVLIVLIGNFVTDLIYGRIDPRVGKGYVGE